MKWLSVVDGTLDQLNGKLVLDLYTTISDRVCTDAVTVHGMVGSLLTQQVDLFPLVYDMRSLQTMRDQRSRDMGGICIEEEVVR